MSITTDKETDKSADGTASEPVNMLTSERPDEPVNMLASELPDVPANILTSEQPDEPVNMLASERPDEPVNKRANERTRKKKSDAATLINNIPKVVDGRMHVETWLRPQLLKSLVALSKLPAKELELLDAIAKLNKSDKHALLAKLIHSRAKSSAVVDLYGVAGIPIFLCFITLYAAFEPPDEVLMVFIGVVAVYMFTYYFARLQFATLDSLLSMLRIASEYPERK
ncbi:MAG: hypothetical protein LBG97_09930 [Coriobacteriales bacterium]|nr:hypothetical protein [Coriobacteriales bacterium]